MKKYLIETIGEVPPPTQIYAAPGYSVYRNPDENLKQQIKDFQIDRTKIKLGWPQNEWNILEWEDEEVKCSASRNVHFFPRKDVEEALQKKEDYERNQAFPPVKHFTKVYGVISYYTEQEYEYDNSKRHYWSLDKLNLEDILSPRFLGDVPVMQDPTQVCFFKSHEQCSTDKVENGPVGFKYSKSGESLNLYFNKEGDFVNRNYNQNLNLYKTEDVDIKIIFEKFKESVLALDSLKIEGLPAGEKFFTDKYCFVPYAYDDGGDFKMGIEGIPVKPYEKGVYKVYRKTVIYKPAQSRLVLKSAQDMFDLILSKIPDKYQFLAKKYFEKGV